MPILINEVIAEVPDAVVPRHQGNPPEERMPVPQSEHDLMKTLALLEERKQRLLFD